MPSREEYEWAAKACGYEVDIVDHETEDAFWQFVGNEHWEPLDDDGDCFRAMVDAGISVDADSEKSIYAERASGQYKNVIHLWVEIVDHPDKQAATRQAVFDCLIAIGKEAGD